MGLHPLQQRHLHIPHQLVALSSAESGDGALHQTSVKESEAIGAHIGHSGENSLELEETVRSDNAKTSSRSPSIRAAEDGMDCPARLRYRYLFKTWTTFSRAGHS
jgi:hypothetical protein